MLRGLRGYAAKGRTFTPGGGGFRVTFRVRGAPEGRPRTQNPGRQRGKIFFVPFLTLFDPFGGFPRKILRGRVRGAHFYPPGGGSA